MAVSRKSDRQRIAALLILAGALGLHCGGPSSSGSPEPPKAAQRPPAEARRTTILALRAGVRVAGDLAGEVRTFGIDVPAGWFLLVLVEQRGIDVVVTASDPAGRRIVEIDSPTGDRGVEVLPLVARVGGRHVLDLRGEGARGRGGFELRIEALRPAQPGDRSRAEAAVLDAEGAELAGQKGGGAAAAEGRFRRALVSWRRAGDARGEAITWRRLGNLQRLLGAAREEVRCNEEALRLVRTTRDRFQEARVLSALGLAYRHLGASSEAEAAFRSAEAVARSSRDPVGEGLALEGLAGLAKDREELAKALDLYDQALALLREHGEHGVEATVLHNLGTIYLQLNRLDQARDSLEQALALRREARDRAGEARTLLTLGQIHDWQGESDAALRHLRRAWRLCRESRDLQGQAIALDKLGNVYLERGQLPAAASALRQAADLFRRLGDRERLGWTMINEGRLLETQGRRPEALRRFVQARDLLTRVDDRTGEAASLYQQALAMRQAGDHSGALARIEEAVELLDSLRADAPAFSLQSSYLAPRRGYWELWTDLLMDAGQETHALEASERNRARSFLETLGASPVELRRGLPAPLLAQETDLTGRINTIERALRDPGTPVAAHEDLDRRLRALLLDYEKLQARLRATPRLAAAHRPTPLNAREIQEVLDDQTLLLVYALGETRSFLWAVDRHSVHSFVLPPRKQIEARAHRVWDRLSRTVSGGRRLTERALDDLSQVILGPLARRLDRHRLAIVADGALHNVPFAALPAPRGDPAAGRPLIKDHEIVSLDSPSVLALLRQRLAGRPRAPLDVAVLADPVFSADDVRVTGGTRLRGARPVPERLARLPFTRREAEVLGSLVPRQRLLTALDFAASRELVLSGALRRYRILHLATHGLLHPLYPELSGIAFSQVDAQGRPRDGFLRAYELFDLDLPADLVVLSACRTSPDPQSQGEGLVGMTRGFMVAGAPRVIVSLWNVDDRSTAELMERFYRGLFERRLRPAAALREAQISLAESPRLGDPFYWAPFIFEGEWR